MPDRRRHGQDEDRSAGRTRAKHGLSLRDRLVGFLPHYAPLFARLAPLANWRNKSPLLRALFESVAGISAKRALPEWRRDIFEPDSDVFGPADGREVVLFADTFNRAYERENLDAALRVLVEGGYRVHLPKPADNGRPLCCGRTFLSAGLVDHARAELDRLVATYAPFAARGVPIVGLEPSCLLTLRDELLSLRSDDTAKSISAHALLFEEFLVREAAAGRLRLPLGPIADKALVHGHCHQKSFGAFKPVEQVLRLDSRSECRDHRVQLLRHGRRVRLWRRHLPGLDRDGRDYRCCRRCGAPTQRRSIVADGTSCRHQIKDGTDRAALHVARVLAMSLDSARIQSSSLISVAKEPIHG